MADCSDGHRQFELGFDMKKFLIAPAGLVAVGIAAPASAADLGAIPATKARY